MTAETPPQPSARHYDLRTPRDGAEWDAYHLIRRKTLFERYHPDVSYDCDHADESKPGNFPLGLIADGELVGTVRIDLLDETRAALRLVAIHPDRQGQGLGAVMLGLAEDFIRRHGRRNVVVHGSPPAVGFYLANGYVERRWVDDPPMGQSVDVAKDL